MRVVTVVGSVHSSPVLRLMERLTNKRKNDKTYPLVCTLQSPSVLGRRRSGCFQKNGGGTTHVNFILQEDEEITPPEDCLLIRHLQDTFYFQDPGNGLEVKAIRGKNRREALRKAEEYLFEVFAR